MKNSKKPIAQVVVGLGFGDEGKGTMTDYFCRLRGADLVVRYNGGSQAAHNVLTNDNRHHTFAQFGSGTFVPNVRTLLTRFVLVDPFALAHEAVELSEKLGEHALNRHLIDGRAPIITPFHAGANQLREYLRGANRHGSCGRGVGETAYDLVYHKDEVILARELGCPAVTKKKLKAIQDRKRFEFETALRAGDELPEQIKRIVKLLNDPAEVEKIALAYQTLNRELQIIGATQVNALIRKANSVWEGAQGVLLDEWHGFHPHTTWSTTTTENVKTLLEEAGFDGEVEVTGLIRAFTTRHGAGPLPTEDDGLAKIWPGEHNQLNDWQGTFRVGGFDGVLLRYAVACLDKLPLTNLAVTHLDVLNRQTVPYCDEYLLPYEAEAEFVDLRKNLAGTMAARELIPQFTQNLAHQEQLTKLLYDAVPIRIGELKKAEDLLGYVMNTVKKPVHYVSFGPKTADKCRVEFL